MQSIGPQTFFLRGATRGAAAILDNLCLAPLTQRQLEPVLLRTTTQLSVKNSAGGGPGGHGWGGGAGGQGSHRPGPAGLSFVGP